MDTSGRRRPLRVAGSALAAGAMLAVTFTAAAHAHVTQRSLAAPGYGGTFSIASGQADCLDPQKSAFSASTAIFENVVDTLLALDSHGRPKADLATHWKVANGGTVITFFLRQGVKFSNGDPFTAQDVKYTFDRALDPATKSPSAANQLNAIASTTVVNKYTVRLTLKTPFRPLFSNLASPHTGIIDRKAVQSEGDTGFCQKPIGTGPYEVASTGTAFDTVTLVANKYHTWEPAIYSNHGRPYIGKLVFQYLTSASTTVSELLSGQLDEAPVPGDELSRVTGNKNIKLVHYKPQAIQLLGFNTASPPFDNLAVRKAVAEAIDRSAVIKAAANGLGIPAYSGLAPGAPYYDKNVKKYLPKLNTADASKIITANHAAGPYTLLIASGIPIFATEAELIQAELASVGMTVNVETRAIGDYISLLGKGQFDLYIIGYGAGDPDALYSFYDSANGKGAGLAFTNFVNARLDNDLVKGRTTLAAKKAAKYYNDAQEIIAKNVIIVPLFAPTSPLGVRTRVHGCCDLNPNAAYPQVQYWVVNK